MGSDQAAIKPLLETLVLKWAIDNNVIAAKQNIRPWGGYEVALSANGGQSSFGIGRPFGSAYSIEYAKAEVLKDIARSPDIAEQMKTFVPVEKVDELVAIVQKY